jgi:uncharacterized iron-regulated membrane protein
MRQLRTVLFWIHLAAGTTAGLVILVMSFTGAVLAMKPQIVKAIDRRVRVVPRRDQARVPVSAVVAAARTVKPGAVPVSLAVDRDPSASAAVAVEGATIYVDPYSGAVLGEGSARTQAFFRTVENWHRWVGLPAENRPLAKSITGACNLAFLVLGMSGIYLWWPRKWSVQHARPILTFRRAATARARDFNWHNVIGFWCAPAIIVMTATATVMSYPWANDLLFRMMGSEPPSANRAQAVAPGGGGRGGPGRGSAEGRERGENREPGQARREAFQMNAAQLDAAWTRAEALMPSWSVMTMRLPTRGSLPVSFTITDGHSWNAFARSNVTLDAASGDVRQWQPYTNGSLGQKARGWFRFAHTGELFGIAGQIIAGIGCLGGVVLVWTGLSLALRRLFNWKLWSRLRVPRAARRPDLVDAPTAALPD